MESPGYKHGCLEVQLSCSPVDRHPTLAIAFRGTLQEHGHVRETELRSERVTSGSECSECFGCSRQSLRDCANRCEGLFEWPSLNTEY